MNKTIDEFSKRNIIKISNNMCMATYAIKEVSLNIFMALLTEIQMEDTKLKTYDITLLQVENKLKKRLNRTIQNFENIRNDMIGNNLYLSDQKEAIALCTKFEFIQEDGVWFIQIEINPLIAKELLGLTQKFTQINFEQFMLLNGLYCKRMYMILCHITALPRWRIYLEKLHTILLLPTAYQKRFDYVRSRVLNPAIKQINDLPDKEIVVSYTVDKRGTRRVKLLSFQANRTDIKRKKLSQKMTQNEKEKARKKERMRLACEGKIFNN